SWSSSWRASSSGLRMPRGSSSRGGDLRVEAVDHGLVERVDLAPDLVDVVLANLGHVGVDIRLGSGFSHVVTFPLRIKRVPAFPDEGLYVRHQVMEVGRQPGRTRKLRG